MFFQLPLIDLCVCVLLGFYNLLREKITHVLYIYLRKENTFRKTVLWIRCSFFIKTKRNFYAIKYLKQYLWGGGWRTAEIVEPTRDGKVINLPEFVVLWWAEAFCFIVNRNQWFYQIRNKSKITWVFDRIIIIFVVLDRFIYS